MKGKLFGIILWIGFIALSVYVTYPYFMDALLGIEHVTTIGAYDKRVEEKTEDELQDMWEAAWKYNEKIAQQQKKRSFRYLGPDETDKEYESLLVLGHDDNTMGSVQVPTAGIDLPIAHGTLNKYLDFEAGHIYGTSLPVGGENTHAIIAGHTGLRNADIFTHLDKVQEGDDFYISVLNKRLVYKVVRIIVVVPEEENPYMQIEDGRDLVTLYTCTPYGVNSHRLLITGERNLDAEATNDGDKSSEGITKTTRDMKAFARCIMFGAIPFVVAIIMGILLFKKKKKKKQKEQPKESPVTTEQPEEPPITTEQPEESAITTAQPIDSSIATEQQEASSIETNLQIPAKENNHQ